jgi:DNA polymerase-3 subunit delta
MFYIFHGDDEYTRAEELTRLKARVIEDGVGELNVSIFDGKAITVVELMNACNTLPFFTGRRLIIVTDMLQQHDRRTTGRSADDLARLAEYLPRLPETTRLVFDESATLSEDKGLFPSIRLLPNGYVKEFPRLHTNRREDAERLRQWVSARARAKGVSIEPAAIARLIDYVSNDLRQLDAELEKLAGRVAYAREIRVDDVLALVVPNPETRVYEMLDHLGMRNRSGSLKSLHGLLATDPRFADGLYPLAMIVVRLEELLTLKDLAETQQLSDREVRGAMKVEEWRYKRLSEQSRLYTPAELTRLIQQAVEIDQGIKTGVLAPLLSLEMLLIDATRRPTSSGNAQRERNRSRIR